MKFLTFTLLLALTTPASAMFSDTNGHRYQTGIEFVQNAGIVGGYEDGTYKPDAFINRAEFTKIIVGTSADMLDINACKDVSDLSDVPSGTWFTGYVCIAKAQGIISGYDDGTFRPSSTINYAEAAKIIAGIYSVALAPQTDIWYETYTNALSNAGLSLPVEPGTNITRAQMAQLIYMSEQHQDADTIGTTPEVSPSSSTSYIPGTAEQLASNESKVLFFHAEWCPKCRAKHEFLTNLYNSSSVQARSVLQFDYDTETKLRQQYGVLSQDTFVLVDDKGNKVELISFPSEEELTALINQ